MQTNQKERTEWCIMALCITRTGSKQLHRFSASNPIPIGEVFQMQKDRFRVESCEKVIKPCH